LNIKGFFYYDRQMEISKTDADHAIGAKLVPTITYIVENVPYHKNAYEVGEGDSLRSFFPPVPF